MIGERGWEKDLWRRRYPLFYEVMSDSGRFGRLWPIRCRVVGNCFYGNTRGDHTIWSRVAAEARAKSTIEGERLIAPELFVDYDNLDLRFSPGSEGVPEIPFSEIGLYLDAWRGTMPIKSHYRSALRRYFDGIPSMPGYSQTHRQWSLA